jgi:hypothetical protein
MQIQAVEQTDKMPPMPLPTLSKEEEKGRLRTYQSLKKKKKNSDPRADACPTLNFRIVRKS